MDSLKKSATIILGASNEQAKAAVFQIFDKLKSGVDFHMNGKKSPFLIKDISTCKEITRILNELKISASFIMGK